MESRISDLEHQIANNENKGSFLAKLLHLKNVIVEFEGLGDFESLLNRLTRQEEFLNGLIQKNREKNLEIKKAFLEELKILKNHFNLREVSPKIKEIRSKWIRTGLVSLEFQHEIEQTFNDYISEFHERERSFYEDKQKMLEDYVGRYKMLIEKAGSLSATNAENLSITIDDIKNQWSKLPKLPAKLFLPLKDQFRKVLHNNRPLQNLKGKGQPVNPDLNEIKRIKQDLIKKLEENLYAIPPQVEILNTFKTNWKNLPRVFSKDVKLLDNQAFILFDKYHELIFAYTLGLKKINGFDNYSIERQCEIMLKYLNEFLIKEKKELEMAKNNSGIIYTHDNNMQQMLDRQLRTKARRIEIKASLINDLKEGKINITGHK